MPFLRDPDRYRVALLDAMLAAQMGSLRACSTAVVVLDIGIDGDPPSLRGSRIVTNWLAKLPHGSSTPVTRAGTNAGTIDGRAGSLRKKYRRNMRPSEANWRVVMGRCFLLAFGAIDRDRAWARIQELAASIGEDVFARVYLWIMLNHQFARVFEDFNNHARLSQSA